MAQSCKPDSSGADWFKCHLGTVGCPRFHDGLSPHCIECAAGGPCSYQHDPPALEMTEVDYARLALDMTEAEYARVTVEERRRRLEAIAKERDAAGPAR